MVVRTIKELGDDDATHMAAGVAYYALFSLFPFLLGLIAIIGLAADSNTVRSEIREWAADNLPGTGDFISDNVIASAEASGSLGAISIIGLIWSGSAIFGAITKVVNRAWDIQHDRPFIKGKIMQLSMALSVGILFALALTTASLAQTAERYAHTDMPILGQADEVLGMLLLRILSFVFNLAIFLILYKVLPNTQDPLALHLARRPCRGPPIRRGEIPLRPLPGQLCHLQCSLWLHRLGDSPSPLGLRQRLYTDPGSGDEFRVRTDDTWHRQRQTDSETLQSGALLLIHNEHLSRTE